MMQESLRLRHLVARNIVWNWAGMVVEMIVGFVVAPYLVRRLGVTTYGLWIVIGALSGYFSLLDLGLRGSVGRQLAYQRAHDDWDGVNHILNSALAMFCGLAVIALVATAGAIAWFDHVFEVPADQIGSAQLALLLVGINVALSLPLQVFDGYLWAAQRFDILNRVDIPVALTRAGLTFALVHNPGDIVSLAIITLATQAGSGLLKGWISFKLDRSLRLHARHIRREAGKQLFAYGWWSFLLTVARLTKAQVTPMMIGAFLGVAFVTPFSIARRLQDYAHKVLWTATGVVVPVATGFHAKSQIERQQKLLLEGGKYSATIAFFFVAYFVCLGESIIALWMGSEFQYVALLLILLTLGEVVQMTQSLTGSIILATARHRALAWMACIETAVSLLAIGFAANAYGLAGVCLALALPQVVFSGFGTLLYGCKVTGVGITRYMTEAMLPAAASAAVPAILLAIARSWVLPMSWPLLLGYSAAYTVIYLVSSWLILRPHLGRPAIASFKTALFHAST